MKRTALALAVLALGATACTANKNAAQKADRAVSNEILTKYQQSQPVPVFDYSQLRQNLIEIENVQARSTVTHTFFFNLGQVDPLYDCASIGLPIPSTYQLTAGDAKYSGHSDAVVPQIEANGVYTADSTGTHVICLDAAGKAYDFYWEGFVASVTHDATWDYGTHKMVVTGASTAEFTAKKP